ncbi:hypothetical protein LEBR102806_01860 [Levilactobacillus brevis]|uniref:Uncharacterized protein n=1 Tax=Levilactobacillus brevis ATCC 14869 = DSM 20054 TaxID=649758 RepID=U2QS06_LEVBR|nr:hypothetical protein [Levilactobacillus brevis]ERK41507.1 hypothetical protein HMPREF0495_02187 [Levilactobacillus brevis ATCC 14869 = DSM 20054]MCT3571283.1 hypothetical protein [Levilactobacillus brevis]MCT3572193.1 hypothetical protein [Levilactobacillus brevis]SQG74354.1 Uncharacterised protein [Levilactobacillus brevis]
MDNQPLNNFSELLMIVPQKKNGSQAEIVQNIIHYLESHDVLWYDVQSSQNERHHKHSAIRIQAHMPNQSVNETINVLSAFIDVSQIIVRPLG